MTTHSPSLHPSTTKQAEGCKAPKRVFARDGWRCQICWRKVNPTAKVPNSRAATIDHIVPLSIGGTHEPINCQTACFSCNSLKGDRHGYGDQLRLIA